jgi:8-oxo-dGTP diphosphatase
MDRMSRADTVRVVNIAVISGPCLLLLRRALGDSLPGYWEIPGGGVEPAEPFEDAAARELEEETGIRGARLQEVHYHTGPAPAGFRRPLLELAVFLLEISPRPEVRIAPAEHSEYRWARPEELRELRMMELNRAMADRAWASRRGPEPTRARTLEPS